MNKTTDTREYFDGREYSILSRSDRNPYTKTTFGDVLAIYCNQTCGNEDITAFISTHIASRKATAPSKKDTARDAFLKMMVALAILEPIKVGGENGYLIKRKPTGEDFRKAWKYCNKLHNNGRKFEAFKDSDGLLTGAAKKSAELMSVLVSTLLNNYLFDTEHRFSVDMFINDLCYIYQVSTAYKIMNCLAVNGAVELYYTENPDGVITKEIKFNRIPLTPDDLQNYAKYQYIPQECAQHVHREKAKVKCDIPFFENFTELNKFYCNNMVYLLKKYPDTEF